MAAALQYRQPGRELDASEHALPAHLELATLYQAVEQTVMKGTAPAVGTTGVVRLVIDATGAVYPITIDPLATSAAWTAESNQADANFGWSVGTAGDVNGDGYSDVIVGAPLTTTTARRTKGGPMSTSARPPGSRATPHGRRRATRPTPASAIRWHGGRCQRRRLQRCHRRRALSTTTARRMRAGPMSIYGSASGFGDSAAWTAESDQAGAHFGYSVATAGDVNGDGYSDVIVGAPDYDNGQIDEGRAFVYYGSAGGPAARRLDGRERPGRRRFGYSVATAGDVNGDGYSDVIVGATDYDNGQADEGRAYVYHGSAVRPRAPTPPGPPRATRPTPTSAVSVATAGDVNGDGYADVIVGAPYYDNGQTDEGRAFVYHGSAAGLGDTAAWTAESDQADAYFGASRGDGRRRQRRRLQPTSSSARPDYDNGQTDEGRAYVYHGSAAASASRRLDRRERPGRRHFGCSVATAGDVNGDGYSRRHRRRAHVRQRPDRRGPGLRLPRLGQPASALAPPGPPRATRPRLLRLRRWPRPATSTATATATSSSARRYYDNGQADEGRAYVYLGSADGLGATPAWTAESNQARRLLWLLPSARRAT